MKLSERKRLQQCIAASVHPAVCEATSSDGLRYCTFYAVTGSVLSQNVFGGVDIPQASTLLLDCDPDCFVGIDASANGFDRGEYHCWFGSQRELIDLTRRHYKRTIDNSTCMAVR